MKRRPSIHTISFGFVSLFFLLSLLTASSRVAAADKKERDADFQTAVKSIVKDDLLKHVEKLASPEFEGRQAGTEGGKKAREYLIEEFKRTKLRPAGDDEKYEQLFDPNCCNVVGYIKGSDRRLRKEYILVGGHYDHVGIGNRGKDKSKDAKIFFGADDNASGTSALIELAEAFTFLDKAPRRSILFVAFDAEEKGMVGSNYWVGHSPDADKVIEAVNVDMIGRYREDKFEIAGSRTGYGWRKFCALHNDEANVNILFNWELVPDSDHWSMYKKNIPTVFFFSGMHDDVHQPTDTFDKINGEGMQILTRMIFGIVYDLAEQEDKIRFRPTAGQESPKTEKNLAKNGYVPPSRLGATFEQGANPSADARITKIEVNSPAAKAGLKNGDRIVEFDGQKIESPESLMGAIAAADKTAVAKIRPFGEWTTKDVTVELIGHPLRLGLSWRVDDAEPGTLVVSYVVPGSPAALAGLKANDYIYKISGQTFKDENEFFELASTLPGPLELQVENNGRIRTIWLEVKPPKVTKPAV